jgi:3-hydroxybutyryl-CoA dehydrogenase
MKILIIGEEKHLKEFQDKFGTTHECLLANEHHEAEELLDEHDLTFDFVIDEAPDEFDIYVDKRCTVFLNTCKISLSELSHMASNKFSCTVFGFNGLPTFFNRPVLEAAVLNKSDEPVLTEICAQLKTEIVIVEDRVGLVTPRVIAMIINEAYYSVLEGTASRGDIDIAMKLGTNYPYGPFEWCERIGIRHVYELLEAIYEDTRDERYKICPLLKNDYLKTV